jgi:hypothetical protein
MLGPAGDERGEAGVDAPGAGLQELAERDEFPGAAGIRAEDVGELVA